jgi:hypothetical protein
MSGYLLDTNVISELRKPKPHGAVLAWLDTVRGDELRLSAVTLAELQRGVERTRRNDAAKAEEIETWINRLEESLAVVSMDSRCFREWARLMEGQPTRPIEDAMIAATARIFTLTVATRNERDFEGLGVKVINPFKPTT